MWWETRTFDLEVNTNLCESNWILANFLLLCGWVFVKQYGLQNVYKMFIEKAILLKVKTIDVWLVKKMFQWYDGFGGEIIIPKEKKEPPFLFSLFF